MTVLSGLMILIGLAGIVVPVLPGLLLVWGGVAVWAVAGNSLGTWVVLAVATLVAIGGSVVKYLLPGKRLKESGVPWTTVLLGTALGIAGFFVIPVVGVVVGFVLGVFLAEWQRLGDRTAAWPSTKRALAAVGWSILIELATALVVTGVWVVGLVVT